MKKGILVVVSGFSGVGKGTIVRELISRHENYALSVSATTRSKRLDEVDGKEYFFVSREEFERRIRENELIEYATYVGNYYGTPRDFVEQKLSSGKNVILEIEVQGAIQIKKSFPDALTIFVIPPSAQELMLRLTNRGRESADEIQKRLARAKEEAGYMNEYEYLLVNDRVEDCVERLHEIVAAAQTQTFRNEETMKELRTQLDAMDV